MRIDSKVRDIPESPGLRADDETKKMRTVNESNSCQCQEILLVGVAPEVDEAITNAVRSKLWIRVQSSESIYEALIRIGATRPVLVIVDEKILLFFGQSFLDEIRYNARTTNTNVAILRGDFDSLRLCEEVETENSISSSVGGDSLIQQMREIAAGIKIR